VQSAQQITTSTSECVRYPPKCAFPRVSNEKFSGEGAGHSPLPRPHPRQGIKRPPRTPPLDSDLFPQIGTPLFGTKLRPWLVSSYSPSIVTFLLSQTDRRTDRQTDDMRSQDCALQYVLVPSLPRPPVTISCMRRRCWQPTYTLLHNDIILLNCIERSSGGAWPFFSISVIGWSTWQTL